MERSGGHVLSVPGPGEIGTDNLPERFREIHGRVKECHIPLQRKCFFAQHLCAAENIDRTAAFSVSGFLNHILSGRVSIQSNQNGWTALENLVGDAFVDGHGRRFNGYTDRHAGMQNAPRISP